MKKTVVVLLLIAGVLISVLVVSVLLLISMSKPLPSIGEVVDGLPEEERQSLEALCREAGLETKELRPIYGWDDSLMGDDRNRLCAALSDGKIRGLRFAGRKLTQLPDLGGLRELRALWLDDNRIAHADMRPLAKLETVNLARNRLTDLSGVSFPASLQRLILTENEIEDVTSLQPLGSLSALDLSRNRIADLAPLASLRSLRTLSLAHNQVTTFAPLVPLSLERLDLQGNRVSALPERLPAPPTWRINLDGNPVLAPPGYLPSRSYTIVSAGTGGGNVTQRGVVVAGTFEVSGSWETLPALRSVDMPGSEGTTRSIGNVTLQATVDKGRVRFYLHEPDGFWKSTWIEKGMVEGFPFVRRVGWVYSDATPGSSARLVGRLLDGAGYDPPFQFQMEPLDGPAQGIRYRVSRDR